MLICWIALLKMNKKHFSGLELFVKALYVSRRVEEKTNKPKKTPKNLKQKNKPKEEQAALYQVTFPNSYSTLLHFTPPNPPAHCECRLPSFGLLMCSPYTGLRFPASQYVPLDLGLDTSCQNSVCACSRHL